jgi:hypothetical protein
MVLTTKAKDIKVRRVIKSIAERLRPVNSSMAKIAGADNPKPNPTACRLESRGFKFAASPPLPAFNNQAETAKIAANATKNGKLPNVPEEKSGKPTGSIVFINAQMVTDADQEIEAQIGHAYALTEPLTPSARIRAHEKGSVITVP